MQTEDTPLNNMLAEVTACLPQTQCGACGFGGCAPYAEAMVNKKAPIHLCVPGGERVVNELAVLLQQDVCPPVKPQGVPQVARINALSCIGCGMCQKACPTDCVAGAPKQRYFVLEEHCTGCGLCVAPCPVEGCIALEDSALFAFVPALPLPQKWQWERQRAAEVGKLVHQKQQRVAARKAQKVRFERPVQTGQAAFFETADGVREKIKTVVSSSQWEKIEQARAAARMRAQGRGQPATGKKTSGTPE